MYGTFYIADHILSLRVGRHIAAWGQSLFFSGVALAQSTADSTRATVPGADVKSILLPTNQVSMRFSLRDDLTLLGQYQFEFKPFEIDPVGTLYSPADIVGPGREFAYGFKNPLVLDVLAGFNLSDPGDIAGIVQTINSVFDGQLQTGALEALLNSLPALPIPVSLPSTGGLNPINAPPGISPTYAGDIEPDDPQYGVGLVYALTDTTELGAYYLRYHQKTPAVSINFGQLTIIPPQQVAPGVSIPGLTTADLGLNVPETYNIRYFDNVDLYALGFSTLLFGVNVGGEVIRREGIDVLLDIDEGVNGIVPAPSRANSNQVLLNGIYTTRPPLLFDAVTFVAEAGWVSVDGVEAQISHEGAKAGQYSSQLSFDREAFAIATLTFLEKTNIVPGLDLKIPISYQQAIKGRSPLAGAFGSLFDQDDIRLGVGVGVELTWLQRLTVGMTYSGFIGGNAHFLNRPLQDRDTVDVLLKYNVL